MFYDKEKNNLNRIETLIGEGCKVNGNFSGTGLLKVDGIIEGDINWEDDIIIGVNGEVNGSIYCNNAFINGTVNGNVNCSDSLTIENQGRVKGDISIKKLVINESGFLDGKCSMVTLNETPIFLPEN